MDKALKQRLVGASVLIALAVIILPMLLSGRPESAQQQSETIELPARPDGLSFETRRFPLAEQNDAVQQETEERTVPDTDGSPDEIQYNGSSSTAQAEQPGTMESNSDDSGSGGAKQAADASAAQAVEGLPPVKSVELPVSEKVNLDVASKPETAVVPEVISEPESSTAGRYAVQVASLGNDANARRLKTNLESKGYTVMLDQVASDAGKLNRVRVGPFASEAEAATAVNRIRSQVEGVNPRMVDLNPAAASQTNTATDPLVRWVVQLGSFGDASNAENLVKQVRAKGMSAYSELVTSSAGTSINRVRVGPYLQREEAAKAQQDIKSGLNIAGVVMSDD